MLTTYNILMSDLEILEEIHWKYMIIDEAQRAKSQNTKLFLALKQIKADAKLLLTGTPLQVCAGVRVPCRIIWVSYGPCWISSSLLRFLQKKSSSRALVTWQMQIKLRICTLNFGLISCVVLNQMWRKISLQRWDWCYSITGRLKRSSISNWPCFRSVTIEPFTTGTASIWTMEVHPWHSL